jgi:hypothetical protein
VPWSCIVCTPVSARPSWSSWPSCGKQALSDLRNRIACGRNVSFLVRKLRPVIACENVILALHILIVAYLASLVLGNLVLGVLLAVSALAVCAACLGNVDLWTVRISMHSCVCCSIPESAEVSLSVFVLGHWDCCRVVFGILRPDRCAFGRQVRR